MDMGIVVVVVVVAVNSKMGKPRAMPMDVVSSLHRRYDKMYYANG